MSRVVRGIVFSEVAGFRPLELDLHLPDDASGAPWPVVLELHGGGWMRGTRREFIPGFSDAETFDRITAAGFAVVAADYRLSGEARFPAQLDDVRSALRWLAGNAAAHGCDPGRIVLWGSSAGGTLAALAGLEPDASVRGVVDWFGPSDLVAMEAHTRARGIDAPGESREDRWIGGWVRDNLDLARAASPVQFVREGAPPFLIAHGAADDDVPPAQSRALHEAMARAGAPSDLHLEPGSAHCWRGSTPASVERLFDNAIEFARRVTGTP